MKSFFYLTLRKLYFFLKKSSSTIFWLIKVVYSTDMKNHVKCQENVQLLTILANGPSLKDDLDKIDFTKGDFSVVNDFYLSPYYKKIKPKYHVLADPVYFRNDDDIKPFIDAVRWDMKFFVPYSALRKVALLNNMPNKYIEVVPYNSCTYQGFECFRNWIYRKGLAMPKVQNVVVASIFTGINMGYKEIRLYGVDHSWTEALRVNNNNQVCFRDTHFWDGAEVQLTPWYTSYGEPQRMHLVLRDLSVTFYSYHQLRLYANDNCCKIINYTPNSYIDAFDRNK